MLKIIYLLRMMGNNLQNHLNYKERKGVLIGHSKKLNKNIQNTEKIKLFRQNYRNNNFIEN